MKVVILAGGMGTRLREETEFRPKPMVEIGGIPILWHIMKIYSHYGFKEFILCLGYKGESIRRYFLDYHLMNCDITLSLGSERGVQLHHFHEEMDWKVTLADTGAKSQTGFRIKQIEKYLGDDKDFMLTYGDGVADVDIHKLIDFHRQHGRVATVTGVHPASRWGELLVDGDEVQQFREKPQLNEGVINGGFFVLDRRVFDYIDDNPDMPFEREPMGKLAEDRQLMVYRHDGFWYAMDTLRDTTLLNEMWKSPAPPWKVWS